MSEPITSILKYPSFWCLLVGIAIGVYIGYHVGLVTGYERALEAINNITKIPQALLQSPTGT
jgi:ABC-type nitrate/sulfonate/bicarbonate transport system permease component